MCSHTLTPFWPAASSTESVTQSRSCKWNPRHWNFATHLLSPSPDPRSPSCCLNCGRLSAAWALNSQHTHWRRIPCLLGMALCMRAQVRLGASYLSHPRGRSQTISSKLEGARRDRAGTGGGQTWLGHGGVGGRFCRDLEESAMSCTEALAGATGTPWRQCPSGGQTRGRGGGQA